MGDTGVKVIEIGHKNYHSTEYFLDNQLSNCLVENSYNDTTEVYEIRSSIGETFLQCLF